MSNIRLPPSESALAELIAKLPRDAALIVRQLAYQRDRYKADSDLLDRVRAECVIGEPIDYSDMPHIEQQGFLEIDGPIAVVRELSEYLSK